MTPEALTLTLSQRERGPKDSSQRERGPEDSSQRERGPEDFSQRERGPKDSSQRERGPDALPAGAEWFVAWLKARQRHAAGGRLRLAVDRAGRHDRRSHDPLVERRSGAVAGGAGRPPRHLPRRLRDPGLRHQSHPTQGITGLSSAKDPYNPSWQGKTVYVTLVPEADGKHWRGGNGQHRAAGQRNVHPRHDRRLEHHRLWDRVVLCAGRKGS